MEKSFNLKFLAQTSHSTGSYFEVTTIWSDKKSYDYDDEKKFNLHLRFILKTSREKNG